MTPKKPGLAILLMDYTEKDGKAASAVDLFVIRDRFRREGPAADVAPEMLSP